MKLMKIAYLALRDCEMLLSLVEKTLSLNAEENAKKEKRKLALQVEELKQNNKKIIEEACRAVSAIDDGMKNLQK
ncbi:hypothetical protein PR048_030259 [Dryococelus australis]|uniref:Uncharacterized protein n=1 Tax=Dryococelus australis TaxID=614101 RepID=A0ABQ9G8H1_9NEOP|nr:hypothetical protein PR048_030259 [Dryococelus australis]